MEGLKMKTQLNIFTKAAITAIFVGLFQAITISATLAATITSTASGDWSSTSTWAGGVVPVAGDDVIITSGHAITLDVTPRSVNSLQISTISGLTGLVVPENHSLTIASDLTLSRSGAGNVLLSIESGHVRVNGNIVMSGSSSNCFIDMDYPDAHLELGGVFTAPTQGGVRASEDNESSFSYIGSATQTITIRNTIGYHNLYINKTGSNSATLSTHLNDAHVFGNIIVQSGRFSNGGFSITGIGTNNFTVQNGGTFVMGGTTSLPIDFINEIQSGSTVIYSSNSGQTVGVPDVGNYHNLVFEGSGTKTLGGNIVATGNLNILAGTLDASTSNYNISLAGNWNNTGATFNARNATVTFNGSTAQSITSNANSFYNVVFNNTANGTAAIALNDDVTITNTATLTDGIINTSANMLSLSSTTAANLSGFSSASYVNGNLRRYIATNTSTYAFPVGTSAYQRIDVKNNNMTGVTYIDGRFGAMAKTR
jgi:hypothetical protein